MSTIVLAKELGANPVLLDDYRARKLAKAGALKFLEASVYLKPFTYGGI
jgi:predicted nucleic acid-binding protein